MKKTATKNAAAKRVKGPAIAARATKQHEAKAQMDMRHEPAKLSVPDFFNREGGVLSKADAVVYGRGEKVYGHPAENFEDIAAMWTVFLGNKLLEPISATDVAQMNILTKSCRLKNDPTHRDSLVDQAGYAETHARVLNYGGSFGFALGEDRAAGITRANEMSEAVAQTAVR